MRLSSSELEQRSLSVSFTLAVGSSEDQQLDLFGKAFAISTRCAAHAQVRMSAVGDSLKPQLRSRAACVCADESNSR